MFVSFKETIHILEGEHYNILYVALVLDVFYDKAETAEEIGMQNYLR